MPDISMCQGGRCRLRLMCFRHRVIPSTRQSIYAQPPFDDQTGDCEKYVELSPHLKEVRSIEECNQWAKGDA